MINSCIACGVEFKKIRKDQKSCGVMKCRKKAWKIQNREHVNKKQREWFKEQRLINPEKYRWYVKNRKHLLRQASKGLSGKNFNKLFTLKDWQRIKKDNDNKCVYCKEEKDLTIDHIIPLSKGGLHIIENIQPLCRSCNSRKKDFLDFNPARNMGKS